LNSLNIKSKVCAVIPFYNEKDFILEVVLETLKYVDQVIAVNDGSNDGSEKQISNLSNVKTISLNKNFGKGFALQIGFDEAIKLNFDYIMSLDGDKQHKPELIPNFLLHLNHYDVVIGNRLNDKNKMPLERIISNKITSYLLSLKTRQKILDSQCGYRAFKKPVLESVKTYAYGYEAESEFIVFATRKNFKIGFIEIPAIYGNEKSKMNPVKAIFGFLKVLFN
jgi:glycosyltransferase involved in cell wall biosynthesis